MLNHLTESGYLWILLTFISIYWLANKLLHHKIRGYIGEKITAIILTKLEKSQYKVINNVVLNINGRTSQIDHLVISDFGIFIIETKNYKGWILGGENSDYWTQVIYKYKNKFYNPILQNYSHIQSIKHTLREYSNVKFIPIVVFSTKATIKTQTDSCVIYSTNLLKEIRKHREVILTEREKDEITNIIYSANTKEIYDNSQHIRSIKKRIKEREKAVEQNRCPRCGKILVLRNGKFGQFKGCSNYPRCKYTIHS